MTEVSRLSLSDLVNSNISKYTSFFFVEEKISSKLLTQVIQVMSDESNFKQLLRLLQCQLHPYILLLCSTVIILFPFPTYSKCEFVKNTNQRQIPKQSKHWHKNFMSITSRWPNCKPHDCCLHLKLYIQTAMRAHCTLHGCLWQNPAPSDRPL